MFWAREIAREGERGGAGVAECVREVATRKSTDAHTCDMQMRWRVGPSPSAESIAPQLVREQANATGTRTMGKRLVVMSSGKGNTASHTGST